MKFDIRYIKSMEFDIATDREIITSKMLKENYELPNFPVIGGQIKIGLKNYRVHSITIPRVKDLSEKKNNIINVH